MEELQAKEKPKFEAWRSEHSPVGAGGDAEKASPVYVVSHVNLHSQKWAFFFLQM